MLERFGGHAQAAGLSMPLENVEKFRCAINDYAARAYGDMPFTPLNIDCKLRPSAFSPDMVHSLEVLAPFGTGNAVPTFGLFGMRLDKVSAVGASGNHLRLELSRDGNTVTAMNFGCTPERFGYVAGDMIDLAVTADVSEYSGREQVTLTVKGIRPSGIDEDALLKDIRLYEQVKRGEDATGLEDRYRLTRNDVAAVYRAVRRGFDGEIEALMLRISDLSYAKIRLALDVLCELGLIEAVCTDMVINVVTIDAQRKFELSESELYRKIGDV